MAKTKVGWHARSWFYLYHDLAAADELGSACRTRESTCRLFCDTADECGVCTTRELDAARTDGGACGDPGAINAAVDAIRKRDHVFVCRRSHRNLLEHVARVHPNNGWLDGCELGWHAESVVYPFYASRLGFEGHIDLLERIVADETAGAHVALEYKIAVVYGAVAGLHDSLLAYLRTVWPRAVYLATGCAYYPDFPLLGVGATRRTGMWTLDAYIALAQPPGQPIAPRVEAVLRTLYTDDDVDAIASCAAAAYSAHITL